MIRDRLGWEPKIAIKDGLMKTYFWIKEQIEKDDSGKDFSKSEIVVQTDDSLLKL